MIPFINPWNWFIYNHKMPTIHIGEPEPKKDLTALIVYIVLGVLFGIAIFNVPTYMRHKFDSIDAWGISAILICIVYAVLLYICTRKIYKLK